MKKFLIVLLSIVLLCLSACNTHTPNSTDATAKDFHTDPPTSDTSESSTPETTGETSENIPYESGILPLPKESAEFIFSSGAGAWQTVMTVNSDGTFAGRYLDSEMGETGEGYPKGSAYTCTFSGKFENIEKVNNHSYKMTLTEIKTEKPVGEEWIEEEVRYIATEPAGLSDPLTKQECTEFIFYLPDTPVEQVPEEFLFWWPYRSPQETDAKTTLSCYGILNVATNDGFFFIE